VPVVARYRAPGPPRPGRAGRLRVKRSRSTVTVRWARVKGAQGYSVRVTGADGRREVYFPSAKRPQIRILTVAPTTRFEGAGRGLDGQHQDQRARLLRDGAGGQAGQGEEARQAQALTAV
jgi:hypothetical protein